MIGTGPFMKKEWVPNQKFVAEKNPTTGPPTPRATSSRLDEIDRPIVEVAQRVNALESGDISAMHTSDPRPSPTCGDSRLGDISLTESTEFGEV